MKKQTRKLMLSKVTLKHLEAGRVREGKGGQSSVCESGYPCISWIIECAIDSYPC